MCFSPLKMSTRRTGTRRWVRCQTGNTAEALAEQLFRRWPIAQNEKSLDALLNSCEADFDELFELDSWPGIFRLRPLSIDSLVKRIPPAGWQTVIRELEWFIARRLDALQSRLLETLDPESDGEGIQQLQALGLGNSSSTIPLANHLALHIASSMMGGTEETKVTIDFIQISADIDCPAHPSRFEASDKVTGLQLGHFGGFYKESWRANDWMWGRIDGALQLLGMLLEPGRVREHTSEDLGLPTPAEVGLSDAERRAIHAAKKIAEAAEVIGRDPVGPGTTVAADQPDMATRRELWDRQWEAGVKRS